MPGISTFIGGKTKYALLDLSRFHFADMTGDGITDMAPST
jgi:hypothetical protein